MDNGRRTTRHSGYDAMSSGFQGNTNQRFFIRKAITASAQCIKPSQYQHRKL